MLIRAARSESFVLHSLLETSSTAIMGDVFAQKDLMQHLSDTQLLVALITSLTQENTNLRMMMNTLMHQSQSLRSAPPAEHAQVGNAESESDIVALYAATKEKLKEMQKINAELERKLATKESVAIDACQKQIRTLQDSLQEQYTVFIQKSCENQAQLEAEHLRYDDMQSRLYADLQVLQHRFNQVSRQNECLQAELHSLQIRSNDETKRANLRIRDFEMQLEFARQQLQAAQEKRGGCNLNYCSYQNNDGGVRDNPNKNLILPQPPSYSELSKYSPLTTKGVGSIEGYGLYVQKKTRQGAEEPKESIGQQKHVISAINMLKVYKGSKAASVVPPLKQTSAAVPSSKVPKKRKLYNPDSVDYLNDVE